MTNTKNLSRSFWMSIIAMVVSIVELAVSIYEAQIMKDQQRLMYEQQQANVWPDVTKTVNVNTSPENKEISIKIENKGVGPAKVKSNQLLIQDQLIESYDQALTIIKGEIGIDQLLSLKLDHDFSGVLSPNEVVEVYKITVHLSVENIWSLIPKLDVCYCSIYDDC